MPDRAADGVDVQLDPDELAERLKNPEVARALARFLLRRVRDRLTAEAAPVPPSRR